MSKTFGDAMELDLATKAIRNLTAHYPHHGYTRALYLSNGDILLSGPEQFDLKKPGEARVQCWLYVLDRSGTKAATPLGTKCSEGPAVSRKRLHIAWTHVAAQYPDEMPAGTSRMQEADIVYQDGKPRWRTSRLIVDSRDLPFRCTLETQNYRPPEETELTFSAYGYQGTDVAGIDLATKKVINYSNSPGQYDEPEGIFPDGKATLVECDKQNLQGSGPCGPVEAQAGRQRRLRAAHAFQRLSRLQGLQSGRQRRRPVHRLPNGQVARGGRRRPRHFCSGLGKGPSSRLAQLAGLNGGQFRPSPPRDGSCCRQAATICCPPVRLDRGRPL